MVSQMLHLTNLNFFQRNDVNAKCNKCGSKIRKKETATNLKNQLEKLFYKLFYYPYAEKTEFRTRHLLNKFLKFIYCLKTYDTNKNFNRLDRKNFVNL